MNTWMTDPFTYPEEPINRGKVLTAEEVDELGFDRYADVDGDGIPYRTIPGNPHPKAAYFNRGTGHNEHAVYSEKPEDWVNNMDRILRKFETARDLVPEPVIEEEDDAEFGIIAFGSTLPAIEEARFRLAEKEVPTSFMRLRALPVNEQVREFVEKYDRCYVVELNRDGQIHQILRSEMPELSARLVSLAYLDGLPLTSEHLLEMLAEQESIDE